MCVKTKKKEKKIIKKTKQAIFLSTLTSLATNDSTAHMDYGQVTSKYKAKPPAESRSNLGIVFKLVFLSLKWQPQLFLEDNVKHIHICIFRLFCHCL